MSLQLLVNGVDFTSSWRPFESRWTQRAWQGEVAQSEIVVDDVTGAHGHANFAARKIVEIWEDASGTPICLYRGRIANKQLGPGVFRVPGHAMRWTLQCEDYNIDLRGIRVENAVRNDETDDARVEAIRLAYLNGSASTHASARDSTDLDGNFIGTTPANAVNMVAETYTDSTPADVLQQITEKTGRIFFVYLTDDGDGELVYISRPDEVISADITITDDAFDEGADGIDVYAAEWGPAGDHAGQDVLTGGAVRYLDGSYFTESDIPAGAEALHDKWETTIQNDTIRTEAVADDFLHHVVAQHDETNTYLATIWMRAEHAHRIRAGMMVPLIRHRANKPADTKARAVVVTHEPVLLKDGQIPIYKVSVEIGRPQFTRSGPINRRRVPRPPQRPTEGTCTRLYFADEDLSGLSSAPGIAAGWEVDSTVSGGSFDHLTTTPSGYSGSHQVTDSSMGSVGGTDILAWRGAILLTSDMAAVLAAGGATVRMQARARTRFGIGISESSQNIIGQLTLRVTQGNSTTIRGTPLAMHSLGTSVGSTKWVGQSTKINRVFPPTAADDTLTAVSGCAAGDYLIVEVGARNFTTVTSGFAIALTGDSTLDDLPEDEVETAVLNSWIEICSESSGGSSGPGPGTLPGEETWGDEDDDDCYAPCGHQHAHGFLADDGTHLHDADQIAGLTDPPTVEGFLTTTGGEQHEYLNHGSTGAAETIDLGDANVHDVTLDTNCTFTFAGATSGVGVKFLLIMRQDSTGSRVPTFPSSVIWPNDTEPTWSTDPDATDVIEFTSIDGGTTWYGDAGSSGGAGSVTADDIEALGFVGPILISDTPSTPLVFADLVQNDDQDDLLYADL